MTKEYNNHSIKEPRIPGTVVPRTKGIEVASEPWNPSIE